MNLFDTCLEGCAPAQIINLNFAFNNVDNIQIYDKCNNLYNNESLEFAYSIDSLCWSCYMKYENFLENTIDLKSDFYLRIKLNGDISKILVNGSEFYDYTTSIASGFNFSYCSTETQSKNTFNPYINMDCAIALQQQLTESIACMIGIPCYYFKLMPDEGSRDITFKEYALMNVESVKQIKLIIAENQMPSSKPEFNDWGLDWQTDWETEISKGMFATAFGITAQPQEGDLIYIPMMKRMWMVNEAYEEKRDAFMWNATTFKVTLVKYQEKDSVDLKDTEALVNTFVKNKYEDLFSDEENLSSEEESLTAPQYAADNLYPVFESDSTRKYVSTESLEFKQGLYYFRGTMIANSIYEFNGIKKGKVIYQRKYCGDEGTFSFIINTNNSIYKGDLLTVGNIKIMIKQNNNETKLTVINVPNMSLTIENNKAYFVYLRFSKQLNTAEFFAAEYVHADVPLYKLQNHHYWFDMDNGKKSVAKFNIELVVENRSDIILSSFYGIITNIKIFDVYIDSVSEILQMYPTSSHLLVNDTAREVVDMNGLTSN